MNRHVIYIPGLGDRYDSVRKLGLLLWRQPGVIVTHVPMRWRDANETFEEKLARISKAVNQYPDYKVTLVGESAGGAMAIVAMKHLAPKVDRLVTLCGMNQGAENVNPNLYRKNPAFRDTMLAVDEVIPRLTDKDKAMMELIYSSADYTIRPKNTLIPGIKSTNLKIFGHMQTILSVLFLRFKLILK